MYALVDCNNFYCSCERLFNPKIRHRPVIVLSNNDGCAISRSEEAKALGIAMAAPVFMMRNLIEKHHVVVFSSNYTLYGDLSNRIMETLASFAPKMETYSIDEAFLHLHDLPRRDLGEFALEIRQTLMRNIGIPVSIGIGPSKTLAKMANRYTRRLPRKPAVFWASDPGLTAQMLAATPVAEIWGIGNQYALLLTRSGFRTAADFVQAPDDWVKKHLSVVGLRLLRELRGEAVIPWEEKKAARKNICTSRSFGKRIGEKAKMAEALSNYAASCAAKLRDDGRCCRSLQVFIQTNPHKTGESQYLRSIEVDLARPSNHTGEIIKAALQGLNLIFQPGFLYMKCGVTVMNLVPESSVQTNCFESGDLVKNKQMMDTMDQINRSLGREMVRSAVQGFERSYRLKADYRSPCYTTRMKEILKIRI